MEYLELFASVWPTIATVDIGRYLFAATLMWLIVSMLRNYGLARRKIQARSADAADIRRELMASLRTALIFSLVGFGIYLGARTRYFVIDPDFSQRGFAYLVLSLVALLIGHDGYFYWTHRAMHHSRLYRLFHRTHHLSVTPTPFAAYAFSTPEALVQAAFLPLALLVAPLHELAIFVFLTVMIVRNVMGHAGHEIHPRVLGPGRTLGFLTTTTHHDLHHQSFRSNFGLYFTWWDKLMGTEHPEYGKTFRALTVPPDRDELSRMVRFSR
jgi:sterol desaturase/sphingolipid hydroxylase (fatty acid hydroxylase superfamily)